MMTGFGMGFGLIGLLFMILFWGGLAFGAVWLVRALFDNRQGPSQKLPADRQPRARDILDQRYARGEITREQYELMKSDLG